jgi:hypothetical protein
LIFPKRTIGNCDAVKNLFFGVLDRVDEDTAAPLLWISVPPVTRVRAEVLGWVECGNGTKKSVLDL